METQVGFMATFPDNIGFYLYEDIQLFRNYRQILIK